MLLPYFLLEKIMNRVKKTSAKISDDVVVKIEKRIHLCNLDFVNPSSTGKYGFQAFGRWFVGWRDSTSKMEACRGLTRVERGINFL